MGDLGVVGVIILVVFGFCFGKMMKLVGVFDFFVKVGWLNKYDAEEEECREDDGDDVEEEDVEEDVEEEDLIVS